MLSIVGACLRGGRFSDDKIGSLLNGPFDSSTTASSAHKHYRLSRCYASCANHVKETHTLRTRLCLESIIPVWGLSWWHQHRATRITGELRIRVWSTLLYHSMHRVVVKHEIHHTHVQQVCTSVMVSSNSIRFHHGLQILQTSFCRSIISTSCTGG